MKTTDFAQCLASLCSSFAEKPFFLRPAFCFMPSIFIRRARDRS